MWVGRVLTRSSMCLKGKKLMDGGKTRRGQEQRASCMVDRPKVASQQYEAGPRGTVAVQRRPQGSFKKGLKSMQVSEQLVVGFFVQRTRVQGD